MRASDRDRERAVALLRARCVEGYLSVDTFEHRLGRVLGARSLAELRVLVADVTRRRWTWPRWRAARLTPAAPLALPAAGAIVVGRSRGCDVVMAQPTISRHHLELRALDAHGWRSTSARATAPGSWGAASDARAWSPATSSSSVTSRS